MQLSMKYTQNLGAGHAPQAVHMMDNTMHVFYLDGAGNICSINAAPPLGQYDSLTWVDAGRMTADRTVSNPRLKKVAHHGAYGFWSSPDTYGSGRHRFIMYALPFDLTAVQYDGSIETSNDSPVTQLSFSAANIQGALMGRYRLAVTPFSRFDLSFRSGSSADYPMGRYFSDRVQGKREEYKISVTARNTTGKLLKEQTFDEHTTFSGNLRDTFIAILELAGVEEYFVADTSISMGLKFDPDCSFLDGLNYVIKLLSGWQIAETAAGTIGIGPTSDARFDQPATYTFIRNATCWSCDASMDDADTYSRLCVKRENKGSDGQVDNPTLIYRELAPHEAWTLPGHKTLYVTVPSGTTDAQMASYADELAARLPNVGIVETFAGIFTPQLTIGDQAEVVENDGGSSIVGTVTSVQHNFGRSGFYTTFTVDSGGMLGKPMLKDYISSLTNSNSGANSVSIIS